MRFLSCFVSNYYCTATRLLMAFCASALLIAGFTHAQVETEPAYKPHPLHYFYRDAVLDDIELSPDGTHLLALKNIEGNTAILVYEISTGKVFYPVKTDNKKFKFNWVRWANNDRLLLSVGFSTNRGMLTKLQFDETRLLAADAKKPSKLLIMFSAARFERFPFSSAICEDRTLTIANSAATKKPFNKTSSKVTITSNAIRFCRAR